MNIWFYMKNLFACNTSYVGCSGKKWMEVCKWDIAQVIDLNTLYMLCFIYLYAYDYCHLIITSAGRFTVTK